MIRPKLMKALLTLLLSLNAVPLTFSATDDAAEPPLIDPLKLNEKTPAASENNKREQLVLFRFRHFVFVERFHQMLRRRVPIGFGNSQPAVARLHIASHVNARAAGSNTKSCTLTVVITTRGSHPGR